MNKLHGYQFTKYLRPLAVVLVLGATGCDSQQPLPEQNAKSVVERFYELISEAKIRGGKLLLHEAYKLTSGDESRYDRAKFIEVLGKYPSGFKADVVNSEINERHAEVTIQYKLASMFGSAYTVKTVVQLSVDEETNTWRIDFKGDTDDQDLATIRKNYERDKADSSLTRVVDK